HLCRFTDDAAHLRLREALPEVTQRRTCGAIGRLCEGTGGKSERVAWHRPLLFPFHDNRILRQLASRYLATARRSRPRTRHRQPQALPSMTKARARPSSCMPSISRRPRFSAIVATAGATSSRCTTTDSVTVPV